MPNEKQNLHSETTPHFDGKNETIVNDSTGAQMGVIADTQQDFARQQDSFPVELKEDKGMKKLGSLIKGD
ncbi:hypothetical protein D3H55_21970 [Bacillus salacetis]|uniref:Uncharacterized protein n=1 Tax=Bacillus salacetis TaxID=2315464 RepID=A0A3A1QTI5_9BACI|nr:hypothetical protein [Bacillus salacetis]RIW28235.1 hypothetical protein D3H55_21970 [Bacillus salacetis]